MTPAEMFADALAARAAGTHMTLVFKRGAARPPGFPRGELLCENSDGRNVYSFEPDRVLVWLDKVAAALGPCDEGSAP